MKICDDSNGPYSPTSYKIRIFAKKFKFKLDLLLVISNVVYLHVFRFFFPHVSLKDDNEMVFFIVKMKGLYDAIHTLQSSGHFTFLALISKTL